jgi:hypothetical protein
MNRLDASILLLRAAGLYLVIRAFERMDWFVAWLAEPEMSFVSQMDPVTAAAVGLIPLVLATLGVLLLVLAPRLGHFVLPGDGRDAECGADRPATAESLIGPGSALIGVVLVAAALPMLPVIVNQFFEAAEGLTGDARAAWNRRLLVPALQVLIQLSLGVGLFLWGSGLAGTWRRAQDILAERRASRETGAAAEGESEGD